MDRGPGLQAKGRASQGSGSPDNAADITTDAFEEAELLRLQVRHLPLRSTSIERPKPCFSPSCIQHSYVLSSGYIDFAPAE